MNCHLAFLIFLFKKTIVPPFPHVSHNIACEIKVVHPILPTPCFLESKPQNPKLNLEQKKAILLYWTMGPNFFCSAASKKNMFRIFHFSATHTPFFSPSCPSFYSNQVGRIRLMNIHRKSLIIGLILNLHTKFHSYFF